MSRPVAWLLITLAAAAPAVAQEPGGVAHFENAVRPVLVERCLKCHGTQKSESGLRVDQRERLLQGGDSGPALVPGDPAGSLLLKAVRHEDDLAMPPTGRLKPEQVAALERWVADGAPWPEGMTLGGTAPGTGVRSGPITEIERAFWSFQPLARPAVPTVATAREARTPIDAFVLDRLDREGLSTRAPADRRTLIRRLTFDLTGLPPTPAEIDAFLADRSPAAYDRLVERLLASPAYGERWGRHWLDVVRYADTAGETADYPTPLAYKYRNWVIQAFNADLPYDTFLRHQLAGDLIAANGDRPGSGLDPEQVRDALTATGFLAISRRFGFDVENYHHLTIQDTIDTVGQSVLGLSLGCARCHDHKFDPVTQAEYYGWYGIFAGTRYAFPGSEEKKRPRDLVPDLAPAEVRRLQAEHQAGLAALDAQLKDLEAELQRHQKPLEAVLGTSGFTGFENESLAQVLAPPFNAVAGARIAASAQSPFANVFPIGTRGVAFPRDGQNNAIERRLESHTAPGTPLLHYNIDFRNLAPVDGVGGATRFYLGHGPGQSAAFELAAGATGFLVKDDAEYVPVAPLTPGTWYNVQVTLDLAARRFRGVLTGPDGAHEFGDRAVSRGWDGIVDYTFVDRYGPGMGETPAHEVDNLAVGTGPFRPASATVDDADSRSAAVRALAETTATLGRLRQDRTDLQGRRDRLAKQGPIPAGHLLYAVVEAELAADVPVQLRGEPTKPGPVAPRRNLAILGGEPRPEGPGSGRRELAEWLTRSSNPLTARVLVNRLWQHHFGRGLVATSNDFGVRGDRPSHPELLDWLAAEFLASGQSIKAMHRLIVRSAVYQQSSEFDSAAAERDPDATLLWRVNRRRLSAEEIRDAMLFVAGDLDRSVGRAHPFPPEETWGFSQHAPFYAVYPTDRRSVYLMQQRLKRHPYLALFDGADPNASTARRTATSVPTQTLFLMNNEFVHRCADDLARRLLADGPPTDTRIDGLLQTTLGRPALVDEVSELRSFVGADAPGTPADQQAAWAAVIRTLLTRNEFLFVD